MLWPAPSLSQRPLERSRYPPRQFRIIGGRWHMVRQHFDNRRALRRNSRCRRNAVRNPRNQRQQLSLCCGLIVRTVNCSFASSGIMLFFVPAWNVPTVTTVGICGSISLLTTVCSATTMYPLASFVSTPPRSLLCTLFQSYTNLSRGTHPLPPPNNPSLHHSQMVPALSLKLTARPGFCSLPVALKFPLTGADYASS